MSSGLDLRNGGKQCYVLGFRVWGLMFLVREVAHWRRTGTPTSPQRLEPEAFTGKLDIGFRVFEV